MEHGKVQGISEGAAKAMMEVWRHQLHREMSESTKRGMRNKAASGGLLGCAPVGYVNRRQGHRAWVEVDPTQGPLVREAFAMAAAGGHSLREIVAVMTEKGLRSSRGKILGPSALTRVFSNPFYRGDVRYEGKEIPGAHEPLVPVRTFVAAQRVFAVR